MKKIYIAVIAGLLMSMLLFIGSFVYLDKSNRRTYDFIITLEGRDIGTLRVDRFTTEEKLIYKSIADIPFAPLYTEIRSRLDLGKRYAIDSYEKALIAGRATDVIYLQNSNGLISFIAKYQSGFSFVDNIPTKKDTFIFEEDSPMTYMPIIENYNFSKGRSQVFNILTPQASLGLPPMKRVLTLTSIKDEYLKINSRKIKTENLILKMRNSPQLAIWVAKSDRAIIRIEMPDKNITITRSFGSKTLRASVKAFQDPRYLSREVVFKSGGLELSGTLTTPTREGRFPAVLLIAGSIPANRDFEGLFASMADHLSRNGISVLRFDKRGIGASKGDAAESTDSEEAQDALAASEYLKSLDRVDPDKIAAAGYGKGAFHALKLLSEQGGIKGLVLIAPELCAYRNQGDVKKAAAQGQWSDDYTTLVMRTAKATVDKVKNAKGSWTGILGMRCYVNGMREEACDIPISLIGQVKIPILILQCKSDAMTGDDTSNTLNKAFADTGNTDCTLVAFNDLGRFFGKLVNDGTNRLHYEADGKVLESITLWLEKTFEKTAIK